MDDNNNVDWRMNSTQRKKDTVTDIYSLNTRDIRSGMTPKYIAIIEADEKEEVNMNIQRFGTELKTIHRQRLQRRQN